MISPPDYSLLSHYDIQQAVKCDRRKLVSYGELACNELKAKDERREELETNTVNVPASGLRS